VFDDRDFNAGQDQAIAIHGAREHNLKYVSPPAAVKLTRSGLHRSFGR
jgi:hypothetical protein